MAEKIDAYQANDGTLHRDECSAVKRDLEMLIQGSPIAENQPYARIVTQWLSQNAHAVGTVLMHYGDACPIETEESDASETLEGTREEGTRKQRHFGGRRKLSVRESATSIVRIPEGVYYSPDGGNFYDATTNAGQGEEFYAMWRDRAHLFPKFKEDACHAMNHASPGHCFDFRTDPAFGKDPGPDPDALGNYRGDGIKREPPAETHGDMA